jgi:probable F420-dependent oxidoreductase
VTVPPASVGALAIGVDLGRCNPARWLDVARAADELGYESVWVPEHLVFPAEIRSAPTADGSHRAVDPRTPVFDAFVVLASLATATTSLRLGTNVFNIGLRHPFTTARSVVTLDVVSGGRVELGIGASWLEQEWDAVGLDFASRGARIDEALHVCRRLWTEDVVEHHGDSFDFEPVVFEPKPVQAHVPVHVGGDSARALRRAAELGDGWIGMVHDPASFGQACATLDARCRAAGRDPATVQRTALAGDPGPGDLAAWAATGATRLIVAPWRRSAEAVDGLGRFATEVAAG